MEKFVFTGFSESQRAYMQGALQAVVFAPKGEPRDNVETLARMIAGGIDRRSATVEMAQYGINAKGWRVMYAGYIR